MKDHSTKSRRQFFKKRYQTPIELYVLTGILILSGIVLYYMLTMPPIPIVDIPTVDGVNDYQCN